MHDRDDQWLYRDSIYDSGPPVAVFLSWNYSSVILRAYCDPKTRELVIEYEPDASPDDPVEPITLFLDDREFPMPTRWVGLENADMPRPERSRWKYLEARLPVTNQLLAAWPPKNEVDIWTPSDMDEAWYVGRAEPLERVIRQCASEAP